MGRIISATLMLLLAGSMAPAQEACPAHDVGPNNVEWTEQGHLRGARVVTRDPRWELEEFDWHGTSSAVCRTCADDQVYGAFLWIVLGTPARRNLDEAVTPAATASRMRRIFGPLRADFHAEGEAAPAALGALRGRGRVIGVRDPAGRTNHVLSVALADGCVELFGVLSTKEGTALSLDRLGAFMSAIDVEWYEPAPDPPPAPKGAPTGDVRQAPKPDKRKSLR